MRQPVNYSNYLGDATKRYVETRQALQGLGALERGNREKAAQQNQRNKTAEIVSSGNFEEMADYFIKYPDQVDVATKGKQYASERSKQSKKEAAQNIFFGGADANQELGNSAQTIIDEGGDPTDTINAMKLTPEQQKQAAGSVLAMLDPVGFQQQLKAQRAMEGKVDGDRLGKVSFKDFTTESIAEYDRTGNPEDLTRYTPEVKTIAGIPMQYNQGSSRWEPVVDMRSPEISEQVKASADLEAEKQSRLTFAENKSKFRSTESKTLGRIDSAKSKQGILKSTVDEIKSITNGWTTEYGSYLSFVPASEARKLKGLLSTLKANSAFSTLSDIKATGGTLGSIAVAELVLLSDAMGALDPKGKTEELIRVVDQIFNTSNTSIDRLENEYFRERKRYSGNYDESLNIDFKSQEPLSIEDEALNWLRDNPDDPQADAVRKKLGIR